MTIGIYCIEHVESCRKYVGKSVIIERRVNDHKRKLLRETYDKDSNRHLWRDVQKHGWDAFKVYVLQAFDEVDEELIGLAELEWMDKLNTCDRKFGYNLRRDTSTAMIIHPETRVALSDGQKRRYEDDIDGDLNRTMISIRSKKYWSQMDPSKKAEIGARISERMRKYHFAQCDLTGVPLVVWRSTEEIKSHYTKIHIPNVYSVADGHKASYLGYIWEKTKPENTPANLLYSGYAPPISYVKGKALPHFTIECIDPNQGVVKVHDSVSDAAAFHGVSYGYMSNCANGRVETINGYEFKKRPALHIELQRERKSHGSILFIEDDLS